jgi:histidinol-phosphate aminotransferase
VTEFFEVRGPGNDLTEADAELGDDFLAMVFAELRRLRLSRYPARRQAGLRELVGTRWGVDPAGVVLTRGGTESLALAFGLLAKDSPAILLPKPSWPEYWRLARAAGLDPASYRPPWDFGVPENVLVCSPENPLMVAYGARLGLDRPHRLVIADLTYTEYSRRLGDYPLAELTSESSGHLLCYSFSKGAALAGARLGLLLGASHRMAALGGAYDHCELDIFQLATLSVLLSDEGWQRWNAFLDRSRDKIARLSAAVESAGLNPLGVPQANFVTVPLPDPAAALSRRLINQTDCKYLPIYRLLRINATERSIAGVLGISGASTQSADHLNTDLSGAR